MESEKLGSLIKELRKDKKLTQEEFGSILGVSGKAVSKWERGESIPDILTLKNISKTFNLSLDELLGERVKKKKKIPKYFLILIIGIIITIILIFTFIYRGKNESTKNCYNIRTYYIDNIGHSNDGIHIYVTLHEFQVEGTFTFKLTKAYSLEEGKTYEFTFEGGEDNTYKDTEYLFNNTEIISVFETDKVGNEQISKAWCK